MTDEDELTRRRVQRHINQLRQRVDEEVDRLYSEHPLDSLYRSMKEHRWSDDDPMVKFVLEAMQVPYPMSRIEAIEKGLLPMPPGWAEE